MSELAPFLDLISRVRRGEQDATAELVRRYEPHIRRIVRIRLASPQLRRVLDSLDICQSVLGSFFVRASLGQYDLDNPEQLVKLLAAIARNKVTDQARREQAASRRKDEGADVADVAATDASPSQQVALIELQKQLAELRDNLTDDERRLVGLRAQGRTWAEVAAELGGTPDGLRMQLSRLAARFAQQLGLEEST